MQSSKQKYRPEHDSDCLWIVICFCPEATYSMPSPALENIASNRRLILFLHKQ